MSKRILFFICCFTVVAAIAQPPQKVNSNYQFKSAGADSGGIRVPKYQVLPPHPSAYYVDSGALAFRIPDSSFHYWYKNAWHRLGTKAANGLNDSAGVVLTGGPLYKNTVVDMRGQRTLWYQQDSTGGAHFIVGDTNVNKFGFDDAMRISLRSFNGGLNDCFLSMSTSDVALPNGFLFLNYQDVQGHVLPNIRMASPTGEAFNLDVIGVGPDHTGDGGAQFWVSNYYQPTYYALQDSLRRGSNFVIFNNGGGFAGHERNYFVIDSLYNTAFGPWWGGAVWPQGSLDIRNNNQQYGIIMRGTQKVNYLTGSTVISSTDFNGTYLPNASAVAEFNSTTKGILPPRMTTVQKLAIASPAEGTQVYDLTLHQMSYYNGTTWINF